jgi:DNA repair protein RadC
MYKFKAKPSERPKISSSSDAYHVLMSSWDDNKIDLCEEFKALYLNRGNKVLSICAISRGGVSGTVVDERHVILGAILQNASGIILCHNHPSNNLMPSQADKDVTQRIVQGAKLFNINTLDHIIVARHGYTSFADDGIMPI